MPTPPHPLAGLFAPFRSGAPASGCAEWYRRLWELAVARPDRVFWSRAAAGAARLLLPHYERAFRGDPRPRAGIEVAEALTDAPTHAARDAGEEWRVRLLDLRCGYGLAGAAVTVARWALQTTLATHAAPRGAFNPRNIVGSPDEYDWTYCGLTALTDAAGALPHAIRRERKGWPPKWTVANAAAKDRVRALLRDLIGPLRPVAFSPDWRTDTAVSLARTMYKAREFSAMPILADALQDAGCDSEELLAHCRDCSGVHVRGCWVVEMVLGRG